MTMELVDRLRAAEGEHQSLLDEAANEIVSARAMSGGWHKVGAVPHPHNMLLEVCGASGMIKNKHFLCYASYLSDYRPLNPWRDVKLSALSDYGWVPLFWRMPRPLPEMD